MCENVWNEIVFVMDYLECVCEPEGEGCEPAKLT